MCQEKHLPSYHYLRFLFLPYSFPFEYPRSTETSSLLSLSSLPSDRIVKFNFSISGLIIDLILFERGHGDLTDMSKLLEGFSVDSSSSKEDKSSLGMMIGLLIDLIFVERARGDLTGMS